MKNFIRILALVMLALDASCQSKTVQINNNVFEGYETDVSQRDEDLLKKIPSVIDSIKKDTLNFKCVGQELDMRWDYYSLKEVDFTGDLIIDYLLVLGSTTGNSKLLLIFIGGGDNSLSLESYKEILHYQDEPIFGITKYGNLIYFDSIESIGTGQLSRTRTFLQYDKKAAKFIPLIKIPSISQGGGACDIEGEIKLVNTVYKEDKFVFYYHVLLKEKNEHKEVGFVDKLIKITFKKNNGVYSLIEKESDVSMKYFDFFLKNPCEKEDFKFLKGKVK